MTLHAGKTKKKILQDFYLPLLQSTCARKSNRLQILRLVSQDEPYLKILHAVKTKKNSYKTLITAEYHPVKVELAPNFEMGVSNKPPEFIKMKPTGKVPVVETPDGPVFESNAIARYVTCLKP